MQSIKDPDLGIEEIIGRLETISTNHSERSRIPKRSQEPYCKVRNSGSGQLTYNVVRESAMTLTCRNYKKLRHKKKDCKEFMEKSDKSSNEENGTRKWCSYHHFYEHSRKISYHQQQLGKIWCTYHKKSGNHSDELLQCDQ